MTPLIQLSTNLYAKCEFMNPTGSHKDRSLGPWMQVAVKNGHHDFVIASSGNAAIAAAAVANANPNINSLNIFISEKLSESKKHRLEEILENDNARKTKITRTPRAKSAAILFARENNAYNLRGSTDNLAKLGYRDLANELYHVLPDCDAIFFPASSGTSLAGVYDGYISLGIKKIPAFHAIQTEMINPFVARKSKRSGKSLAESICDRVAHRKSEVTRIMQVTGGNGWIISEDEIEKYTKLLHCQDIPASPEGGLTYAAAIAAQKQKMGYNKAVILLTGIA